MNYSFKTIGFTLVEMLIVISLMSLFATLAYVSFAEPTREAALDNSHASVLTALVEARNRAMQGSGDGVSGQSVTISADGTTITTESASFPLSPNVTLDNTNEVIIFSRISGITTARTLTLTDSTGNTRVITITDQGYVY